MDPPWISPKKPMLSQPQCQTSTRTQFDQSLVFFPTDPIAVAKKQGITSL